MAVIEDGAPPMELEQELKTYHLHLSQWLPEHAGKFVVIKEEKLLGIYLEYEDALTVGYQQCGPVPFLVKKIEATETIIYFNREPGSCRI